MWRVLPVLGLCAVCSCGGASPISSVAVGYWSASLGHSEAMSIQIEQVGARLEGVARFDSWNTQVFCVPVVVEYPKVSFVAPADKLSPGATPDGVRWRFVGYFQLDGRLVGDYTNGSIHLTLKFGRVPPEYVRPVPCETA